jgi:glutaconate CoA-transferase subunit A
MVSRFAAGAMGIPFMPIRSLLGSDVLQREAMTPEQRAADPRTPIKKAHVLESPLGLTSGRNADPHGGGTPHLA